MSDKESKWYQSSLLTKAIDYFTNPAPSSVDKACDLTLRIMRDHSLRKSSVGEAIKEFEIHSSKVVAIHKNLVDAYDKQVEYRLPVIDDVSSMTIEEAKEFKKVLSQLIGVCDKKISEQQQT